jgi:hypothetical protein
MIRNYSFILGLIFLISVVSCSSAPEQQKDTISIASVTSGLVKHPDINFPLYLINKVESRQEVIAKTSSEVFIVHTGHILNPAYTKEQNEDILMSLSDKGIDLINLTIEDFIIAANQDIKFENYPQMFLNSSVMDLNEDSFITKKNIVSFVIHNNVVFVGLSDKKIDPLLSVDKFLVSDYVMAVLRARKIAMGGGKVSSISPKSFVIVHTIGPEINEVMERLPANFINSLAN